ncbi:MAG: hypothetical protein ACOCUH_00630, partial [Bacteriovoracia bacterium]
MNSNIRAVQNCSLTDEQFKYVSELAMEHAGIKLDKSKIPMIQSRLSRRLRTLNIV